MRLLALVLAALAVVGLPAAAVGAADARVGKPIRVWVPLPSAGDASLVALRIPIVQRRTGAKVAVVVRPAPGTRLPRGVRIVAGAARTTAGRRSLAGAGSVPGHVVVAATFVFPHVLELPDRTPSAPFSFETSLFASLTAGLAKVPAAEKAALDVYLFDASTGRPLVERNGSVCTACVTRLGSARKLAVRVDELLGVPAGYPRGRALRFALAALEAAPRGAGLRASLLGAGGGALDLSAFSGVPAASRPTAALRGAVHAAAGKGTSAARAFRLVARPAPDFTVGLETAHAHGRGRSNLCVRVSTTPAVPGATGTVTIESDGAFTAELPLRVGSNDVVVTAIDVFGRYEARVRVTHRGVTRTAERTHDVGPADARASWCPAPDA